MELVGMEIRKNFQGFGVFTGTIQSYDDAVGYFKIQYEDGDSEEVDFEEIESILREMGRSSPNLEHHSRRSNRGRPKKQRRLDSDAPLIQGTVVDFGNGDIDETIVAEKEGSLKENEHFPISDDIQANGDCNDDVGRRKRQKMSGKEKSTPEMLLRRSARRASSRVVKFEDALVSQDDDLGGGGKRSVLVPEHSVSIKPTLPPSSKDLDFDGLNAFDLFSVYTCLRSFSRLLFLSPFTVQAFMTALRCVRATFLIDSIHFSILIALKPHLELLSEEGSRSASDCLRYLNWEHLDLVTWPVFLVHYLVIHGSGMKPGFRLGRLKLLDSEYYLQPAGVKLEMLRCLCDDVIEVAAIRSELNRRMDSEMTLDASCVNMNIENKRKSFGHIDPSVDEGPPEIDDGNIDECCLCGMDGSLICCDGCPLAFHSRCVGAAKDLLPEGEWYCPECLLEKSDHLAKLSNPFRGAELLGIDPHGRLYFGSCNRLLVSDSCQSDVSYHYYIKDDVGAVITALKSCYAYIAIVNAISNYWGFPANASPSNNQSGNDINDGLKEGLMTQGCFNASLSSKLDGLSYRNAGRTAVADSASSEKCVPESSQLSDLPHLNSVIALELVGMNRPFSCSEPFDEKVHAASCIQRSQQTGPDRPMHSPMQVSSLEPPDVTAASEMYIGFQGWDCVTDEKKAETSEPHSKHINYINFYSFGQIATSIFAELMHKSSEGNNNESKKSVEDIKSAQLKAISQFSTKGYCYAYQKPLMDVQNENCGWCFSCKTSSDFDCLFRVAVNKNSKRSKNTDIHRYKDKDLEGFMDNNVEDAKRRTSEKNKIKISNITSAVHHMLSIEGRAGSLLSGLWEKPHYSQHWRKAVMKADNVASLKPFILSLELNLRRVALSVEWSKPIDDSHAIVSSSIVTSPVRGSSSYVGIRKHGRKNIVGDELSCTSRRAAISDIFWWRGGRLSRQLFQCKMLPQALASKGGRQAGRGKIPHILYPDTLDFPKRSKYISWRVAVEMCQSVAQFMYQAKDFDANIKWSELSNTRLFHKLSKDSKKLVKDTKTVVRRMKNVTICGKYKEGKQVKYLLDFGKRETVPDIVAKHGVLPEEPTVERKRYWLTEAHVPLNLLKSYEEKKMKQRRARLLKKSDSGAPHAKGSKFKIKKRKRSEWLSYLVSKEQKSEKQICGHCNKGVSIREAVNCHFCGGIFHRKHFNVPKGAVDIAYMCNKCRDTKTMNLNDKDTKRVKGKGKDSKNAKARDRDSKNVKEEEDIKNMNSTDRAETSVDVKRKSMKGVKAKPDMKTRIAKDRGKKIMEGEENVRRSERVKQKGIRWLKVKPQRRNIVLKRRKVSDDKELDAITKKGKHVLLKSKKSNGPKRGKKDKAKSMTSENIDNGTSWRKRKRSVVHHPYWLNGLLWTHKSAAEQKQDFRESNIIFPFQNADPSMKPLCSLCCQEYNLGVIYICCERCQDWFHGDAFCLAVESINNLVGFRCHKCRMRSEPICPFLKHALIDNVDLDTECKIGVNVVCNDNHIDKDNENVVMINNENVVIIHPLPRNQDDEPCGIPIVCKENHLDDKQGEGACIEHQKDTDEDHGSSHEDFSDPVDNADHLDVSQSKNDPEEELDLSSQVRLTNGHAVGLQHMDIWERSCDEARDGCIVKSQDCMDEDQSVVLPKEELALCHNALLANVDNVRSAQQVEENVLPTKNENETEVELALRERGIL